VVPPGEVSQRVVPTKVTFTVFDRGSLLYDVSLSGEAADHERYRPVYDQGWQPSRFPNEIGSLDAVVGN